MVLSDLTFLVIPMSTAEKLFFFIGGLFVCHFKNDLNVYPSKITNQYLL